MTTRTMNRRAVLAFIALAEAPTPNGVEFDPTSKALAVYVDTVAAVRTWAALFGATEDEIANLRTNEFTSTREGKPCRARSGSLFPRWRGWQVFVTGIERDNPSDTPEHLTPTTRTGLAEAAAELAPAA